jgi:hypothetical protein
MKWCERCGGPLRKVRFTSHPTSGPSQVVTFRECRLCWLEAVGNGADEQTFDMLAAFDRADCNSPCPHASGWWLPPGMWEGNIQWTPDTPDDVRLAHWLATYSRTVMV